MLWIPIAIAASLLITFANIGDSHILSKRMPGRLTYYLLPMAFTQLLLAAAFFAVFRFTQSPDLLHVLAAVGSGLCNVASLIIMLNCLQKGEVSRVIPVTASYPIFVAILSVPILGEVLTGVDWLAILMTVLGAILLSLHLGEGKGKTKLQKSFILLLFAAVLTAFSNIGFKYSLEQMSVWNIAGINCACVSITVLLFSCRRKIWADYKNLEQRALNSFLITIVQCTAVAGVIVGFVAMEKGEVSLVSAISNIRPAFILIFSLILTRFFPRFISESVDRRTILLKIGGIALITGGVVIIALAG